MADETITGAETAKTSEEDGKNTADTVKGADTQADKTEGANEKQFTQADLDRIAAKARKEEKAKFEKQIADASKSESERLQGTISELQSKLRERDARDAVIEAASDKKIGAKNPRAIYRLIKDDLEFDKEGQITNLKAALAQAKSDYPELFGIETHSVDAGAGGRRGTEQDMNFLIRRTAGRVS